MPFDRFMIAPLNSGLETDVRPWLIPDDAFEELNNAYVFRGRVRKRFGSYLMGGVNTDQKFSRLRVNVGTTDGAGNLAGTVPGAIFQVGQMFSINDELYTVATAGLAPMLDTGATATKTYNTGNGAFVFAGAPANSVVYFYSAQPVMGLVNYEQSTINNERLIAFDTQFAYERAGGGWERLIAEDNPGDSVWTGSNSQFFWTDNYRGTNPSETWLFVTNYNENETNLMRYFDGTTWFSFAPRFSSVAGNFVKTARIIVSFKDKLLLLNTVEDNSVLGNNLFFRNRLRYSVTGNPISTSAFYESPTPGGYGGFVDNLATQEAIVSAEFIKDRLIVFFERSTWEIVYTGNYIQPFRWQKINTELGAESTFSVIPFDKAVLAIGDVGIHACTGANVERIDNKIPDEIFEIHNQGEGTERVYGIRDYYTELAYWTFPTGEGGRTFPNRILVYNYKAGSWAFNDDSITCFGYFFNQENLTWNSTTSTWEELSETWDSGSNIAQFRQIVAGNQEGFTFIIDSNHGRNSQSLQITNIISAVGIVTVTAINHNLDNDDFVTIEFAQGVTGVNNKVYRVQRVLDANRFTILEPEFAGVYLGGGTLARVSQINILTKQYNFYVKQGRNVNISKVDFMVDRTAMGQLTIDVMTSSSNLVIDTEILETSPYALYPLEAMQDRLCHPVYPSADGEFIQLRIFLSEAQMFNRPVAFSYFELHSMTFFASPSSDRLQ